MRIGLAMSGTASLLKRFDELVELGKTLLPFQNDLEYLAKKQEWMASCQFNIEKAFGKESSYCTAFQNLARLGNQEAHITHGLALMEGVRKELEKSMVEKTDAPQVPSAGLEANTKEVFIVHGRDHKPVEELKGILVELGLNPVVLHEKAGGSLTIIEKLEKYSDKPWKETDFFC